MIIVKKMRKILYFGKKCVYLQYRKKPIKLTVMDDIKRNYRMTIIFNDEIMVAKFETQEGAMKTVTSMRDLFPDKFVGGAVEKKRKKWEIIWTAGLKKS